MQHRKKTDEDLPNKKKKFLITDDDDDDHNKNGIYNGQCFRQFLFGLFFIIESIKADPKQQQQQQRQILSVWLGDKKKN